MIKSKRIAGVLAMLLGVVLAIRQSFFLTVPLAAVSALSLGLVVYCLISREERGSVKISAPLLFFIGVYGLSLGLNLQPATAIRVQRFVAFCVGMLAFSPLIRTPRLLQVRIVVFRAMIATLASMVVLSLPIWIYVVANDISVYNWDYYFFGFHGLFVMGMTLSPAAAVVVLTLADTAIGSSVNRRWQMAMGATALVAVILCVAGGSRMTLAALIVAMGYLLFCRRALIAVRWRQLGKLRYWLAGVGMAVIIASVPFAFKALVYKHKESAEHSIFYSREKMWRARIVEFESAPILGIGYAREFPKDPDDDGIDAGSTTADLSEIEPGSSYLSLLSYGGILGSATFLWFLLTLLPYRRLTSSLSEKSEQSEQSLSEQSLSKKSLSEKSEDSISEDSKESISEESRGGGLAGWLQSIPSKPLSVSLLIFLLLNAITEGWLMFAGALLFPIFWLTTTFLANDHHNSERTGY